MADERGRALAGWRQITCQRELILPEARLIAHCPLRYVFAQISSSVRF